MGFRERAYQAITSTPGRIPGLASLCDVVAVESEAWTDAQRRAWHHLAIAVRELPAPSERAPLAERTTDAPSEIPQPGDRYPDRGGSGLVKIADVVEAVDKAVEGYYIDGGSGRRGEVAAAVGKAIRQFEVSHTPPARPHAPDPPWSSYAAVSLIERRLARVEKVLGDAIDAAAQLGDKTGNYASARSLRDLIVELREVLV